MQAVKIEDKGHKMRLIVSLWETMQGYALVFARISPLVLLRKTLGKALDQAHFVALIFDFNSLYETFFLIKGLISLSKTEVTPKKQIDLSILNVTFCFKFYHAFDFFSSTIPIK